MRYARLPPQFSISTCDRRKSENLSKASSLSSAQISRCPSGALINSGRGPFAGQTPATRNKDFDDPEQLAAATRAESRTMCLHKLMAANSTHVVCDQCTFRTALDSTKNAHVGNRPHFEANRGH